MSNPSDKALDDLDGNPDEQVGEPVEPEFDHLYEEPK